jgi:hypothetical protein
VNANIHSYNERLPALVFGLEDLPDIDLPSPLFMTLPDWRDFARFFMSSLAHFGTDKLALSELT